MPLDTVAVPLENILTAAGWKSDCVFEKKLQQAT